MANLTWAVVLLPLGAAGAAYLPELPRRAAWTTIVATAASFLLSLAVLADRLQHLGRPGYQSLITFWTFDPGFQVNGGTVLDFHPQLGVLADSLSVTVLPMVAVVSLLVQVYSLGYMRGDPGYRRFFALVSLFTFFMLALVASPNFFQLYLMWEGVGVCSYLLIGHWWHKPEAAAAATKAFLVTRLGDLCLLAAIVFNWSKFAGPVSQLPLPVGQELNDPFNFTVLAEQWHKAHLGLVTGVGSRTLVVVAVLVLLGAVGKSAQLPLHVWLPDAMEGPTPISALIHAATMVAAGAYLVARTYPLFLEAPHVLTVVALVGGATAVFGAVVAMAHTDIKRIIAYSTISHLGLMFLGLGVGAYSAAVFHLLTHAWFKALLFLAAGNLIRLYGTQDIREMGAAWRRMPWTAASLLVGCCSAAGVVLFAGFWSKDAIVAGVLRDQLPNGGHLNSAAQVVLLVMVALTSLLGAVYPFRLFFCSVLGRPPRRRGFSYERVREVGASLRLPVVVLAGLSTLVGFAGIEGLRASFDNVVFAGPSPPHSGFGTEGALLGGSLALFGVFLAYVTYQRPIPALTAVRLRLQGFGALASRGFDVDVVYRWLLTRLVLRPAAAVPRIDETITDGIAAAVADSVGLAGTTARRLQTGRLQAYTLTAVASVAVLVGAVTLAASGHLFGIGASR